MALRPAPAAEEAPAPAEKKSPKKLVAIVLAIAVAAAAGWFFVGRGGEAEAAAPEPGEVLAVDPITLNLADGHFLKLGLSLQLVQDSGGHGGGPDGSKALDLAIDLLSNREVAELSSPQARNKLKAQLSRQIEQAYHGEVMDLYFTEFVMQ